MSGAPSCTTCAAARASRRASKKSWPDRALVTGKVQRRPLFDPESLPVLGADSHLPPIPAASISAASMRQRFVAPPPWQPESKVERWFSEREPAHASVLVPLVLRAEITVLLTQRTEHLNDHPGQISFPGGRAEADDPDAVATALREAREEIGLEAFEVE